MTDLPADLVTLREGLTEGQRAALGHHCDSLSSGGPAWGYQERYAHHEGRILAAMRDERRRDLYREIARGITSGRGRRCER